MALRMDTVPTISLWFLPNPENPEPKRSDEISSFNEIWIFLTVLFRIFRVNE
uniref:Uncharacterized protein n=1 Tax=Candidatus Kentrum sp. UNK TaxID=2126344 RepID=A0A451AVQ7_9GAMM|nr:MAG: hypothetical protein BECKUNK1418G_GA0071005_100917 [Candidatus Kentron sp. UNK]VFK70123.1 MAG: hypothetical protein BECKUNK1418H_GA0071006_102417 [Candidatus Kentron sp. UNK]